MNPSDDDVRPTADNVEQTYSERNAKTIYLVDPIAADRCGRFHAKLHVFPIFYGLIIGSKGSVIRELEQTFDCKITIPTGKRNLNPQVKISARTEADILALVNRIKRIVSDGRCTLRPSHFVCLPCIHPDIVAAFTKFKADVLTKADEDTGNAYHNIDKDLFITGTKLHTTLATLLLVSKQEIEYASKLLADFGQEKLNRENPLRLTIRGLDFFDDDPKSVNVLYAKLQDDEETARLQSLANSLVDLFMKHGLYANRVREQTSVKLHLTLMNSTYLRQSVSTPKPFSVEGIFQNFAEYSFIEECLHDEIWLCKMRGRDDGVKASPTDFYQCVSKLHLESHTT